MATGVRVDCEAGRSLGCASFCCKLVVRLAALEPDPGNPGDTRKRCVDKDPADGFCVYFERETSRCGVWAQRPGLCREYDCNLDPLLQVVLRDGFHSLTELVRSIPPDPCQWRSVPYLCDQSRSDNEAGGGSA
jgi:hypothetical protein